MRTASLAEVQARLLTMGKAVCGILEEKRIPHFINFGTLLGAVRHGGFIPWDDDFDITIPGEAYEDAICSLRVGLPEDMFLEDAQSEPKYFHSWAHVKDMETEAFCEQFPQDNLYAHRGISVDLYNIFAMDELAVDLFRLRENLAYQVRKKRVGLMTTEEYAAVEAALTNKIQEETVRAAAAEKKRPAYGIVLNERIMYPEEIFPLKKYRFEDALFYGPADPDSILTRFYGDYRQFPPPEQRIPHYSEVILLSSR